MRRILFRIVCQAPRYSNCIRLYTNSGHAEIVKKINQAYSKIDEYNTQINAFVSVRDRRDVLVRVASEGGYDISKPLSGQLVAIKDNFATRSVGSDCQSERTTCGSGILRDYHSPISATVVSLIENSGGIVLGKTNMDEFGMGSLGTFSIHGATINPTVGNGRRPGSDGSAHSAGGSSGGSAAAVASFMCDV
ncbi:Trimeric GatFAB AmidoTransferase(AdT) complex subunit, partial [Spiromyces aspiralis]